MNSRGDGLDRGRDGKDRGAKMEFRRCRTAGLVVPVARALEFRTPMHVASAPRFGEPFVHVVGWRDTLSSIARRHGTTVADLQCALFLQFICQGIAVIWREERAWNAGASRLDDSHGLRLNMPARCLSMIMDSLQPNQGVVWEVSKCLG